MSWAWCSEGHSHWGSRGAAGLLLARDGAALLQLRAGWVHQGGTWSIPGGAIERGESAYDAAGREGLEELGIEPGAVELRDSWVYVCGGWTYETVLGEPVGDFATHDRSESDGHRWVPAAEVDDLPLHPSFRAGWNSPDGVLRAFVLATA